MSGPQRMKAAVLHGREDVRVQQVDVPRLTPGDVLIRTKVALTCGTDLKVYRRGYHARMIVPPALFGHEAAGVVEAVGEGVTGLEPGMAVAAANSAPCGECEFCLEGRSSLCDDLLFWNGAYAEFTRIPARVARRNLLRVPDGLPFRKAAMLEPIACVVRGIEESGIESGRCVAVIGVGAIGLLFVALARRKGARVIAVGRRPQRLARALAMGAEAAISSEEVEDVADSLQRLSPDGRGPHVVIEAVGRQETVQFALRAVRKGGVVNMFGGCPAGTEVLLDAPRMHYEELTVKATFHHTPDSVRAAFDLIAQGHVDPDAFISAHAPLERLPHLFDEMARGGEGLKTAILPWGVET